VAFVDGLNDTPVIAVVVAFARSAVALTRIRPKDFVDSSQEDDVEAVHAESAAAELELAA
jgi:hypothetical protein